MKKRITTKSLPAIASGLHDFPSRIIRRAHLSNPTFQRDLKKYKEVMKALIAEDCRAGKANPIIEAFYGKYPLFDIEYYPPAIRDEILPSINPSVEGPVWVLWHKPGETTMEFWKAYAEASKIHKSDDLAIRAAKDKLDIRSQLFSFSHRREYMSVYDVPAPVSTRFPHRYLLLEIDLFSPLADIEKNFGLTIRKFRHALGIRQLDTRNRVDKQVLALACYRAKARMGRATAKRKGIIKKMFPGKNSANAERDFYRYCRLGRKIMEDLGLPV